MRTAELERSAAIQVAEALAAFRVVAIVGPRQVGKTTVARSVTGPARTFVSFDDLGALSSARADPDGFVRGLALPVTIDEFQRVPEILLAIKHEVDRVRRPGSFLLTGSAEPRAVGDLRETLAGRMALITLGGLTWAERRGQHQWNPLDAMLETSSVRDILSLFPGTWPDTPIDELVTAGGFPEPVLHLAPTQRSAWHEQFARTYLERDVPAFVRLDDISGFIRFVRTVAASSGTLLNVADLARDVGVAHNTADRWRSVLESTFLLHTVEPYWRNVRKRLAKAPKIHFADTGLALSLAGVGDLANARRLGSAGAFIESWVWQHLHVFSSMSASKPKIHTFRTVNQDECDFVLASNDRLLPIEVKGGATVRPDDARGAEMVLDLFAPDAKVGVILYAGNTAFPLTKRIAAVPMAAMLGGPR